MMVFVWGIAGLALGGLIKLVLAADGFGGGMLLWCGLGLGLNRWAMDPRPVDGTTPWRVWFWAAFWSWAWPVPLCWACIFKVFEAHPEIDLPDDWWRDKSRS